MKTIPLVVLGEWFYVGVETIEGSLYLSKLVKSFVVSKIVFN